MLAYIKRKYNAFGVKRPTVFPGQKFNGYAAPLWSNPFPGLFMSLAVLTFSIVLTIVLVYVFDVSEKTACDTNSRIFLIIFIIVLALETISNIYFYQQKIASDIEWSRSLVFLSAADAVIAVVGAISLIIRLADLSSLAGNCEDWLVSLIFTLIVLAYCAGKLFLIMYCSYKFYRSNILLARRDPKEVQVV